MARFAVEGDWLVITPRVAYMWVGLRRRIRIPLSNIEAVFASRHPAEELPIERRIRGTAGASFVGGYMRVRGRRTWWLYRFGADALIIKMQEGVLSYVVVATENPRGDVEIVRDAAACR